MAAAGLLVATLSCASSGAILAPDPRHPGHHRHAELGFAIAAPGVSSTGVASTGEGAPVAQPEEWKAIRVEGADWAFRRGESTWSLQTRCEPTRASARVLARQLLIGLDERRLFEEGPVTLDGEPGWRQLVEAGAADADRVWLETVTTRLDACVIDWIRVEAAADGAVDPAFQAWWRSFRRPGHRPSLVTGGGAPGESVH